MQTASRLKYYVHDMVDQIYSSAKPCAELGRGQVLRKLKPLSLRDFKHIDWRLAYVEDSMTEADDTKFFTDATPQVIWPIDVAVFLPHRGQIIRARSIQPRDVRGLACRPTRYMLRTDYAYADKGRWLLGATVANFVFGRWHEALNEQAYMDDSGVPSRPDSLDDDTRLTFDLMLGIALTQRYEWAVSIGYPGNLSVRFNTDPTGLKELFKDRDASGDRREALKAWITDHWRQSRHDPDVEVYVRKHLRGATSFNWGPFVCEVRPSQYDLDKREEFIRQRAELKAIGADRRPAAERNP